MIEKAAIPQDVLFNYAHQGVLFYQHKHGKELSYEELIGPAYEAVARCADKASGCISPAAFLRQCALMACREEYKRGYAGGERGEWQWRKHRRATFSLYTEAEGHSTPHNLSAPSKEFQRIDDRDELEAYTTTLNCTELELLVLNTYYNMKMEEIAALLHHNTKWARNIRFRALIKIRKQVVQTQTWRECYTDQSTIREAWAKYLETHPKDQNNNVRYLASPAERTPEEEHSGLTEAYTRLKAKIARRTTRQKPKKPV
jgi:DNA-directed RNA polymerase specialized sigma24 family protein